MFTGIVEGTATVREVNTDEAGRRLRFEPLGVSAAGVFEDLSRGQSVSVSGVCLTVEEAGDGWFDVFTAAETLDRTYLGELTAGDAVNVERALRADARLDGHVVQGHVDAVTEVVAVDRVGDPPDDGREYDGDWRFAFALPGDHGRYLVEKGSVALDGVSLTVADLDEAAGRFAVAVIPETYRATSLGGKSVGDPVHVEVDVLAKYVERLLD